MRRRTACVLTLLAALLLPYCGRQQAKEPNVVLITLDTVRADHLGCYGYPRRTSPRLDEFAQQATLYRRSFASSSWTLPTHATFFTGRYAFEHGAHSVAVREPVNNVRPLADRFVTLAEALAQAGYQTAGFVANDAYLSRRWHVDQGFGVYEVQRGYARTTNAQVLAWLERVGPERFFLFVNYMDAHRPYNTAPRASLLERPVVPDDTSEGLLGEIGERVLAGRGSAPPELQQKVIDQYDTALANLDEELGRLLDRLRAKGLYDDALIVIVSDHGESFGEHQLVGHAKDVYQDILSVPLLVKAPRQREGRVVDEPVSSVDLPRLVLAQFPKRAADRLLPLFPYAPGNHPLLAESYFARINVLFNPRWGKRFDRVRTAFFAWPFKLIRSSAGPSELYDVAGDPGETRDLAGSRSDIAVRLTQDLERFEAAHPRAEAAPDQPLSDDQEEALRALGYVGGAGKQ